MSLDAFVLRGCQRCGGDLARNLVERGKFHCLHCGHRARPQPKPDAPQKEN